MNINEQEQKEAKKKLKKNFFLEELKKEDDATAKFMRNIEKAVMEHHRQVLAYNAKMAWIKRKGSEDDAICNVKNSKV